MPNRNRNVTGADVAGPGRPPSPAGPLPGGEGSYAHASHASRATRGRDYTASPQVALQGRTRRGAAGVTEINDATDPFRALNLAFEYLTSVLRRAARRNQHAAWGWCWTVVHIVDAIAAAVERKEHPHPWFRSRASWRLAPEGWAPLDPVAETFRLILTRPPKQEDPR